PPPSPLSCHPHRAPPAPYTSPYTTLFRSTMSEPGTQPATHAFLSHRGLLFTVAYEILGSATDAEDVLQETWLRWAQVDLDRVREDRKSTRLNSSHVSTSYAVFCLKQQAGT